MKVFVLLSLFTLAVSQSDPPVPVGELDINAYIGLWYNTHTNLIAKLTFSRDSYCSTAEYGLLNETAVTVYNAGQTGGPVGELNEIGGIAVATERPGELLVYFENSTVGSDYWVLLLGPQAGPDNRYQYSVVSDPFRLLLFVLVRDVEDFRVNYQEEVLTWLANNGFDTLLTEPIEQYHESDCRYTPAPEL